MASIKIANTSQYFSISRYKNLKRKLLKCNSNTQFNKQCLNRGVIPKYARIKERFLSYLLLQGFCIDVTEDGLSTGRSM